MKYSKTEIVESIRSGKDREVLTLMYKEIFPKLERYILNNSGTKDDSKDVFQEAILVFYQNVMEDKFDKIMDVSGFVLTVGRNSWINRVRKLSKEIDDSHLEYMEELSPSPLVSLLVNEKWDAYNQLFDSIGAKCKEILTYSIFDKRSMREIAELMTFSNENAAKTHNYRCKQRLMELVSENKELADLLRS